MSAAWRVAFRVVKGEGNGVPAGAVRERGAGFTLIELMIAVCIIGVLASVAVPTYGRFMMQSRGSEGTNALGQFYKGAAAYWLRGSNNQGVGGVGAANCLVPEASAGLPVPFPIAHQTFDFSTNPAFAALGYTRPDPGYFSFGWDARAEELDPIPGFTGVNSNYCGSYSALRMAYVFCAVSDIDQDGMWGGFSLGVHGTPEGVLRREAGFGDLFTGLDPGFVACPFCVAGVD